MKCAGLRASSLLLALATAGIAPAISAQEKTLEQRLQALERQNQELRQELATQRETISELKTRLGEGKPSDEEAPSKKGIFNFGPVHIGAEGGLAYFYTTPDGANPEGDFRVDEAKLFLEAPIWKNVYFFSEIDLTIREGDQSVHLGELYLDFENVLRHWTDKEYLSFRVGRLDIPFGEEYLVRDAIDNPLISHSLMDFWGIDEGLELYGKAFGFDYVFAVQNGGHPTLADYNSDKAFVGRLGYNIGKRARVSFSGMRTGELAPANDEDFLSELWFGGGFFKSIGTGMTTEFHARVFQGDGQVFWDSGHLKLAGGYYSYGDDDPAMENERDGFFYSAEVLQRITSKFYGAARFSQILPDDPMPIVGLGDFGKYFFGPFTKDIWRLSLGLGYRWSENLITKIEYAREEGKEARGADRSLDFFGAEVAFKF